MKKISVLLLFHLVAFAAISQNSPAKISIIPEPVQVAQNSGTFKLPKNISIEAPNNDELKQTINFLQQRLSIPTGYTVDVASQASTPAIRLLLNKTADASLGNEGYLLSV